MSAASDDRDLEEALAKAAQLRQRYRVVSQDEPPDAVDAVIRAAAREKAAWGPTQATSRFTAFWRVPLSIAAVVVVSATVSVLVAERHGQLPHDADHSAGAPPAASKDERFTEAGAAQRQFPPAPAGKPEGKARPTPERPQRAAPNEPVRVPEAVGEALSTPPEPNPPRQALEAQETPAAQGPSQDASTSAAAQQAAPPASAIRQGESVRPEAVPDEARAQERAQEGRAEPLRKQRGAQAVAPAVTPAGAKFERDRGVSENKLASAVPPWESDPEAWLKHIDELRVAGRGADAEASFRAFRDRYPDHPLPAGFVVPGR